MKAYDFEYDGIRLSSFGYTICRFGSDGLQTVSVGSQITFNTVSAMQGTKRDLTSSEFKNCLKSTFQICRKNCGRDGQEISAEEIRLISKWLNRRGFHKLKFLCEEYLGFYFEASFNVSKIEMNGCVYGLELDLETNRPFALQEPIVRTINNVTPGKEYVIRDYSDVEGMIYPDTEIRLLEGGTLEIHNQLECRTTRIENCQEGEIIRMNYPMIETNVSDHKIQDDFNWTFFRIGNSFKNNVSKVTISLPCVATIKYSPYVKMGL